LKDLDEMCAQARTLSDQIHKQMAETRRGDHPSADVKRANRRDVSRPKRNQDDRGDR
jgi:hypothetical protein